MDAPSMSDAILTLNAGSFSIKFAIFQSGGEGLRQVVHGAVEGLGRAPKFSATDAQGNTVGGRGWEDGTGQHDVFAHLLDWARAHLGDHRLAAVGHRVVHGGRIDGPRRIDADVLAQMRALVPLAPLHQPQSLDAIQAVAQADASLPQVACFDTCFHHTMPAVARRLALPRALAEDGVQRYGFHGLSYEYIAGRLPPDLARGRVVVAHLGSGASLCALKQGASIDTTMGFTPLDGLVMGTRCGALDPGAVLYLLQAKGLSADVVTDMLYHHSGLQGVSGIAGDMRQLRASDAPAAQQAIELFTWQVARHTGALMASLGGLDGLVFTAGIGAQDAVTRADICTWLQGLGVHLDPVVNAAAQGAARISQPDSPVQAWVIPTDEEAMIANKTAKLLFG